MIVPRLYSCPACRCRRCIDFLACTSSHDSHVHMLPDLSSMSDGLQIISHVELLDNEDLTLDLSQLVVLGMWSLQ